jgi:hypothetical protein
VVDKFQSEGNKFQVVVNEFHLVVIEFRTVVNKLYKAVNQFLVAYITNTSGRMQLKSFLLCFLGCFTLENLRDASN